VRCAGAPRDLGLDQGQALGARLREQLRARTSFAERLRGWLPGSESRRIWRDLQCYFPHHAERTLGLSSGAGVGVRELVPPLATLLEGDAGLALGAQAPGAGRSLLGRSFSSPEHWAVRHSAPETDYRSVELASVSSVAAAVGVNEHGLAAMVKALPTGSAALAGCAAPAALLVQDVLQRFDTVDKAAEWALRRPAGGAASLLLADASGALAGVYIEGRERRSLEPEEGLLFGLGAPADRAALEKVAAATQQLDAEGLARSLIEAAGDGGSVAVADPAGRRLGIAQRGDVAWHPVERG
jgi:hypothetical protein